MDSVLLSPECHLSSGTFSWERGWFLPQKTTDDNVTRSLTGNRSWATFPKPPPDPCAPPDQICDFSPNCAGAQDEDRCGEGSSSVLLDSVLLGPVEFCWVRLLIL